ncbi:MAG: RNA pyrophosphohydrolase [Novosphingobium sp. 28-62-57]|uniref:RNA pyrophosphohydrolase n=1 Tax=unclassified Novosphingobium TaxID=2644732 RepID=UPI000BD4831A|nr:MULTISPECIES: RNA pyrophosphohydrolase [unclassified Novosphingobium]OYW49801.1 MAG: RNA pyrophosphohydrolase [Novosphingobium sp. 12-62-10]OYZ12243.1 MAG: RNA pyrophosphohydrolase [Novosphingobium sp. 28-62-57]OZA35736.1 MAG: RNA pyrophosphohydrolase [Novosphingobium sp. 17-62-9]HQS69600.1 RNA pyrophosphohydrolase [Novosphingobium sp.]
MNNEFATLPYRPCVGVMLVNSAGRVFVGKRIDNREVNADAWQMPQGGIDEGEELHPAALRELQEETGVPAHLVTIIAESREEHFYDLPDLLVGKLWGGKYRGQRQKWLLMRFAGEDTDINLDAHDHAEFEEWKWVEPDLLPDLIVPFKKRVYRQVVDEFRDLI